MSAIGTFLMVAALQRSIELSRKMGGGAYTLYTKIFVFRTAVPLELIFLAVNFYGNGTQKGSLEYLSKINYDVNFFINCHANITMHFLLLYRFKHG